MSQSYLGFRLILVALLIALNGFFAAAEVALLSVRGSRLRQMAEEGQTGAQRRINLLANSARLLSVTQVGVTLSSLGLGWAGEETLFRIIQSLFHPDWDPLLRASFTPSACLARLPRHQLLPRRDRGGRAQESGDRHRRPHGRHCCARSAGLLPHLLPFVLVIERSSSLITNLLSVGGHHRSGGHSAEELKLIVTSSRGLGYLPEEQEDMIHRVLDLTRTFGA